MNVAITGSSGFIGQNLCSLLNKKGFQFVPLSVRYPLNKEFELPDVDAIVHLAAIAHSTHKDEQLIIDSNLRLPIALALKAKKSGIKHFIFLSSSLVWMPQERPLNFSIAEQPNTLYGKVKFDAEAQLMALQDGDFTISIVRPCLVYGAGVKGNLLKMLNAVASWPICPIGVSTNKRSVTNVMNLAGFICHLIQYKISGRYTIQDETPMSSYQMLKCIAKRMPKHAILFEIPKLFWAPARALFPQYTNRLLGSFYVDDMSASTVGFIPSVSQEQGFDAMVANFLQQQNGV